MFGMIVFSYGLTKLEPYRCNAMLAEEAMRIRAREADEVKVAAQWETDLGKDYCDLVIGPYLDRYLSSADVIREAAGLFNEHGITQVIPVAQTFLHYRAVCAQLEKAGYTVARRKLLHIGHNPMSLQEHTRSAWRLGLYAARQKLFGHEGALIVTDQMIRIAAFDNGFELECERLDRLGNMR